MAVIGTARTRSWTLRKSPLRTNGCIQQHVHGLAANLTPRPGSFQPFALDLQNEFIIEEPSYVPKRFRVIILLVALLVWQIPLHAIPVHLSKMTLIQLSIVRYGIGPIILTGRIGIVQEVIVRPVKGNVERRVHPPRQVTVPLSRSRPPACPRPWNSSRSDLVRAAQEGLSHGHFSELSLACLDVTRLNLEDVDLGGAPADALVQPVVLHAIARADELRGTALVGAGAGAPGPNVLRTADVGVPGEIAQQPEGGPQASDVVLSRQSHLGLHDAPREAELIPGLEHGALKVFLDLFLLAFHVVEPDDFRVGRLCLDDQISLGVSVGIFFGVVVLRVVGVIVLFEGGPSRVLSVLEGSMRGVEFVRKNQVVNSLRLGGLGRHGGGRRRGDGGGIICWPVCGRLCRFSAPFAFLLVVVVVVASAVLGRGQIWDDFAGSGCPRFLGSVLVDPASVAEW
mmetsp:Transcript_18812/g.33885  ORF Transcript_18812/g.33885 Transcript_18812/m.33885 type:complete len:454 (+) Transcript_18812:757-2118(+)